MSGKERWADNVYKGNLREIKKADENEGSFYNTAGWTGRDMEHKNIDLQDGDKAKKGLLTIYFFLKSTQNVVANRFTSLCPWNRTGTDKHKVGPVLVWKLL